MYMLRHYFIVLSILSLAILSGCDNNKTRETKEVTGNAAVQGNASVKQSSEQKNILFFGTSLTAGYHLEPNEAYPALIQNKIDSLNLPYNVINGGLSGETSAAGKSRIDWLLKQPVAIFVLELGANDGLRGIPVSQTTLNLQAIIDKVKTKYPDAKQVLLGMQIPPNMGESYATDFKNMFIKLAKKNNMVFVPFLLEGVGGIPDLNQNDGIHPTIEGQKILAENVWIKLKSEL